MHKFFVTLLLLVAAGTLSSRLLAQQSSEAAAENREVEFAALPDAPSDAQPSLTQPGQTPNQTSEYAGKQTRRILGFIPNFRSVSVDEKLPPLSARAKLKLMAEDSFDYSSFIYVGLLAGVAQGEDSYPEFQHGGVAFGRYYWHSFADTIDGNLMTEFAFPVVTKEDPRYYTLGHGGFAKRAVYAVDRLAITRTDRGGFAPNLSEIVGNGSAAGIANLYYPSPERTWTKTGQRWVAQVGLDGVANLIKEFWPDVNSKFFHNKY